MPNNQRFDNADKRDLSRVLRPAYVPCQHPAEDGDDPSGQLNSD